MMASFKSTLSQRLMTIVTFKTPSPDPENKKLRRGSDNFRLFSVENNKENKFNND